MSKKILLKNFKLLDDGSEAEFKKVNLEIEAEQIKKVGDFEPEPAKNYQQIIEAETGEEYILPGFIDMHSHADLMNFSREGLEAKISQGVTTEVSGQCGLGAAPINDQIRKKWRQHMIIRNPLKDLNWNSVGEYFQKLESVGLENNLIYFLPHGLLRYYLKKDSKEKMNKKELKKLEELIFQSFEAGAAGISFGLCYFPAVYADYQELKTIFADAAAQDKLISVHLKSEGSKIIESLEEIIKLKKETKARVNISHLKIIGIENEYKIKEVFRLIKENELSFDSYPYNFGSTTLAVIIPPAFLKGEGLEILKDDQVRAEIKKIYEEGSNPYPNWDNLPYLLGWNNIYLSGLKSEKHKRFNGLSLEKIAAELDLDPADTAFKFLLEEKDFLMQDYYMKEDLIEKILKNKAGNIGTDSLFIEANPHPRTSNTYPKIIEKYVFDKKLLTLSEAAAKFSQRPAQTLPLADRGEIKAGKKADLVIFSKADLLAENDKNGIKSVMINGKWKLKDYNYLKEVKAGQVIKL